MRFNLDMNNFWNMEALFHFPFNNLFHDKSN